MERLTKWNESSHKHAYYPRCFEEPCYGGGCKIKDCPFETAVCDRLAAYEDTGLTPEEIKAPFTEDAMINLAAQALGVEPSRLRELAVADKDGRVVVLPCKVGDILWIAGSIRRLYSAKVRTFFIGKPSGVSGRDNDAGTQMIRTTECDVPMRDFGKTVFLTREEAEKELAEMEGKKDG